MQRRIGLALLAGGFAILSIVIRSRREDTNGVDAMEPDTADDVEYAKKPKKRIQNNVMETANVAAQGKVRKRKRKPLVAGVQLKAGSEPSKSSADVADTQLKADETDAHLKTSFMETANVAAHAGSEPSKSSADVADTQLQAESESPKSSAVQLTADDTETHLETGFGTHADFDANNDGLIAGQEVVRLASALGIQKNLRVKAARLIQFADSDGDHKISLDEFDHALPSMIELAKHFAKATPA